MIFLNPASTHLIDAYFEITSTVSNFEIARK